MADAQVRSGKRRGEFKSIILHFNEHIDPVVLHMCLHIAFIHVPAHFQTTLGHLFVPFVVAVLYTLV